MVGWRMGEVILGTEQKRRGKRSSWAGDGDGVRSRSAALTVPFPKDRLTLAPLLHNHRGSALFQAEAPPPFHVPNMEEEGNGMAWHGIPLLLPNPPGKMLLLLSTTSITWELAYL